MGRKVSGTFQYPLSKKTVDKIETLLFRQKLDNTGTPKLIVLLHRFHFFFFFFFC